MGPVPSEGVVALVTGGYKNLGKEISKQLKDLGYHVIATFRSDEISAERTSEELGIEVHHADMSDENDISGLFSHLRSRGLKVGVLVNNISSFPVGPLLSIETNEVDDAYRSTFRSPLLTSLEAIKDMKDLGWGRVVNISMAGTDSSQGYRSVAVHAAMKGALNILTLSLAEELRGSGINVNAVLPGIIDREGRSNEWRSAMKNISPEGKLTEDKIVASNVVTLIVSDHLTGELMDVF